MTGLPDTASGCRFACESKISRGIGLASVTISALVGTTFGFGLSKETAIGCIGPLRGRIGLANETSSGSLGEVVTILLGEKTAASGWSWGCAGDAIMFSLLPWLPTGSTSARVALGDVFAGSSLMLCPISALVIFVCSTPFSAHSATNAAGFSVRGGAHPAEPSTRICDASKQEEESTSRPQGG